MFVKKSTYNEISEHFKIVLLTAEKNIHLWKDFFRAWNITHTHEQTHWSLMTKLELQVQFFWFSINQLISNISLSPNQCRYIISMSGKNKKQWKKKKVCSFYTKVPDRMAEMSGFSDNYWLLQYNNLINHLPRFRIKIIIILFVFFIIVDTGACLNVRVAFFFYNYGTILQAHISYCKHKTMIFFDKYKIFLQKKNIFSTDMKHF